MKIGKRYIYAADIVFAAGYILLGISVFIKIGGNAL